MDTPQGAGDVTQSDQVQKMTYVLVRMLYQIDSELHRDSPALSYGSHNVHCARITLELLQNQIPHP